jgi:predicted RNase H-like nuclease
MHVVGVDGCRYGWVAVILNLDSGHDVELFRTFGELWQALSDGVQILVDIPIGLKEDDPGERRCDKEAREKLRPRGNSVFPAPRRPTIYFKAENPEYRQVTDFQKELCSKGLSRQTYAIIPKIRQVDELLLKDGKARQKIREVHPEICFWAWNDEHPMKCGKKTAQGFEDRKNLLRKIYLEAENLINGALEKFKRKDAARDDIVDALAVAVTAWLGQNRGLSTLPAEPEIDAHGLPMEMVYVKRKDQI